MVPLRMIFLKRRIGEPGRIRTFDPLIKSQLLYHLSYGPAVTVEYSNLVRVCKYNIAASAKNMALA
jgi:hypothetical protein